MPLTADQITQVFEILGVPQDGAGQVFPSVVTLFGPSYETYDMSAIVTLITAKLAALTASQLTRVTTLLSRWDTITSSSPIQINASPNARGVLTDHPAERDAIRLTLGNILGIAVPSGGFIAEAHRESRRGGTIER